MKDRIELLKNKYAKLIFAFCFILIFLLFFIYFSLNNINKNENNLILTPILNSQNKSIFNIKELNNEMLKGKVILLNIYNIKDFSYVFSLDLAERIQKEFKNKLIIIDIVADEYSLKKDTIINYIIKNNIERPVINISKDEINEIFDLNNNTFLLIDKSGNIKQKWDVNNNKIIEDLKELLKSETKNSKITEIELEKSKQPETFIKSLTHIIYTNSSIDNIPYFIITDSKGRKVYISTLNGNIIKQIGNGKNDNIDGIATEASFCYPFDVVVHNNFLYISDTCNNAIKSVDLKTLDTKTILNIEKPLALAILNDNLFITTANKKPLSKYNFKSKELQNIQCNECSNEILKLDIFNNKIYFLNSKNNILYSIDNKDNINQEINFNKLNKNNDIKIQNDFNFHIDETGFYFVDKFNNRILKIKDKKIKEYSSGDFYSTPTDIIDVKDKLYITSEDNKKLIMLDKNTKKTNIINLGFGYEYNKFKAELDEFLDINNFKETKLNPNKNSEIILNLGKGYSFEKMAPQNLSIFKEDKANNSAILIKNYSKTEILENKTLKLPILEDNSKYYLKGNFYYCNYLKATPCLVKNYGRTIIIDKKSNNTDVIIEFLYQ